MKVAIGSRPDWPASLEAAIALNRAVDQLCSKGLRFPDLPPPAVLGDGDLLLECLVNQGRDIL